MNGGMLDWLAWYALHAIARGALHMQSPLRAKRTVSWIGAHMRPLEGVNEARIAMRFLGGGGSCLSRSMTVAARLPGSVVVLGVNPRGSARLSAHAWVEKDREVVDDAGPGDRTTEELARF
jgi:hypothetical protein